MEGPVPDEEFEDAVDSHFGGGEALAGVAGPTASFNGININNNINNNNNNDSTRKSSLLKLGKLKKLGKKSSGSASANKEPPVATEGPLSGVAQAAAAAGTSTASAAVERLSLEDSLEEARRAVDLFLNNEFEASKAIIEPLADRSIYHALGHGLFAYLEAVLTFEQSKMEEATKVLSQSCDTINSFRKKHGGIVDSLGRLITRKFSSADYAAYSDSEIHAELCYAETLLLRAVMTLCEDETLVSFVKAGLKVRSSYQSYRECWSILQHHRWDEDSGSKGDFENGVRIGLGTFNLMLSVLPARIMRLLEFIGFGGRKESGLDELMKAYNDKDNLRQFLAVLILLGYHLFAAHFIGEDKDGLQLCGDILREKLHQYPNGGFFLFFKGRFHMIQGELLEAKRMYEQACVPAWQQFHHFCYWELMWCHQYSMEWVPAAGYAGILLKESKWSKTFYAYLKAALMCMVQPDLTADEAKEQIQLMEQCPEWKQRIAGKSVPMEKFAIAKAKKFLDQGNHLTLPALELIYLWNGFKILGTSFLNVEPVFVLVEKTMKNFSAQTADRGNEKYRNENWCLLLLLKAVCLKAINSPLQAEECLKEIMSYNNQLVVDTYLLPYALFEYGCLMRDQGHLQVASDMLERAKNEYKTYSFQSRLHFRIHAAQRDLKKTLKLAGRGQAVGGADASNLEEHREDEDEEMFEDAEDDRSGDEDLEKGCGATTLIVDESNLTQDQAVKILSATESKGHR